MSKALLKHTLKMVRNNTEMDAKRVPAGTQKKVLFNTVLDIILFIPIKMIIAFKKVQPLCNKV